MHTYTTSYTHTHTYYQLQFDWVVLAGCWQAASRLCQVRVTCQTCQAGLYEMRHFLGWQVSLTCRPAGRQHNRVYIHVYILAISSAAQCCPVWRNFRLNIPPWVQSWDRVSAVPVWLPAQEPMVSASPWWSLRRRTEGVCEARGKIVLGSIHALWIQQCMVLTRGETLLPQEQPFYGRKG